MTKAKILNIDGSSKATIDLPKCFSSNIREDVVLKVLEAKKNKQPYGASQLAGLSHSASGKWIHRRHVWKSQYGRGWSRIPRKIFSRRGTQFRAEGATSPNTKGGRRAHPPKAISMIKNLKVNKKELRLALFAALSATANKDFIEKKYSRIEKLNKDVPFIVESGFVKLKTKELMNALRKILGNDLFEIAIKNKKVRSGRGKMRGRKYKSNAGMLLVLGNKEKIKVNSIDIANVKTLSVNDLAKGGVGRLTVYTEDAIKEIEERLK
ncbi:MAG: 50S ribosomal protein L4 [Candidatus Pacearchaeota archaeon]|jgi:large subunit ribosomal protein L4e